MTASNCPDCGYRLGAFRCFNCDYKVKGSDGPWPKGIVDQGAIWDAEGVWNGAEPLPSVADEFKYREVFGYLRCRGIYDLALTCDQLRCDWPGKGQGRGKFLIGRVWHVQQGFRGIHKTRCVYDGDQFIREDRRTNGACQGGGVWFGKVTPDAPLVVGEGMETTLSAMILWNVSAGVATLGTNGMRALVLPRAAKQIIIAADNDALVIQDGRKLKRGIDAANDVRLRWLNDDPRLKIEIRLPPDPEGEAHSRDWNDVLRQEKSNA
jgi:hypothetical protein